MLKKQKAALQATKILHQYGIRDVPVDVETLCKELGVKVETELLDDDTSGVIIMKNDRAVIGVNRNHHPNRQALQLPMSLGILSFTKTNKRYLLTDVYIEIVIRLPEKIYLR